MRRRAEMVMVKFSASLAVLLPRQITRGQSRTCSVELDAANWTEATREIALRFDRLASRVFTESGRLRPGLLMAVNDELVGPEDEVVRLGSKDEVYLFQQVAGG